MLRKSLIYFKRSSQSWTMDFSSSKKASMYCFMLGGGIDLNLSSTKAFLSGTLAGGDKDTGAEGSRSCDMLSRCFISWLNMRSVFLTSDSLGRIRSTGNGISLMLPAPLASATDRKKPRSSSRPNPTAAN